jgi:hypothetical protein
MALLNRLSNTTKPPFTPSIKGAAIINSLMRVNKAARACPTSTASGEAAITRSLLSLHKTAYTLLKFVPTLLFSGIPIEVSCTASTSLAI